MAGNFLENRLIHWADTNILEPADLSLDLSPNSGLKMLRADISVFLPAFSSKPSWKTAWSPHDRIANIVQEKITAMCNKLLFNQEEIQFVFFFF